VVAPSTRNHLDKRVLRRAWTVNRLVGSLRFPEAFHLARVCARIKSCKPSPTNHPFVSSAGDGTVNGHPESLAVERNGTRIFTNIPDKKEIVVGDLGNYHVLARGAFRDDASTGAELLSYQLLSRRPDGSTIRLE
jgi:hypothetical protein